MMILPVKKVAIVTDSTADIPAEVKKQLDIHVVPLNVIFGETNYLDGIDITTRVSLRCSLGARSTPAHLSPRQVILLPFTSLC